MRSELLAPGAGIFGHNEARGHEPFSTIVHARTWRDIQFPRVLIYFGRERL